MQARIMVFLVVWLWGCSILTSLGHVSLGVADEAPALVFDRSRVMQISSPTLDSLGLRF